MKKTQKEMIRTALLNGDEISPKEALWRFGCFRLGARIYDLKQDGHNITKTMKDGYAVYRMS